MGQEVGAEKSNEITAIPELLKKIDIRGGVVTIDAMGAQKAIAELNEHQMGGRSLTVNEARPKPEYSGGGGGYDGGGNSGRRRSEPRW